MIMVISANATNIQTDHMRDTNRVGVGCTEDKQRDIYQ